MPRSRASVVSEISTTNATSAAAGFTATTTGASASGGSAGVDAAQFETFAKWVEQREVIVARLWGGLSFAEKGLII